MRSITTEIAFHLPFTSQLRLAARERRLQSLLPHVWSYLQQHHPTGNEVDQEEDFGSLLFDDDDGWKEEYMIRNWTLTRFHMERENQPNDENMSKSLFHILKLILDRISELLGLDLESENNLLPVRSPWDTINSDNDDDDEKQQQQATTSKDNISVHPKFSTWVATTATSSSSKNRFQQLLLNLCHLIGSDRRTMTEQCAWEGLPLDRIANELCRLDRGCIMEETIQRGRAILLGILQSKNNNSSRGEGRWRLKLNPLPEELWRCTTTIDSDDSQHEVTLEQLLQSYLTTADLPNVNAVAIFLWTYHRNQLPLIKKLSHWLPVEPIIPLVRRFLTEERIETKIENEIKIAIEFVLSLEWEKYHLDSIMGQDVTIPVTAKELADTVSRQYSNTTAARRKIIIRDLSTSNKKLKTTATTTATTTTKQAKIIQELFGNAQLGKDKEISPMMDVVDQDGDGYIMENYDDSSMNGTSAPTASDSDSSFDESDDRILLL